MHHRESAAARMTVALRRAPLCFTTTHAMARRVCRLRIRGGWKRELRCGRPESIRSIECTVPQAVNVVAGQPEPSLSGSLPWRFYQPPILIIYIHYLQCATPDPDPSITTGIGWSK